MHSDDADLLQSFKRGAIVSFVLLLMLGGASVGARLAGYDTLGRRLLLLAYLPGLAFAICVLLIVAGLLIFMVSGAGGRRGPN